MLLCIIWKLLDGSSWETCFEVDWGTLNVCLRLFCLVLDFVCSVSDFYFCVFYYRYKVGFRIPRLAWLPKRIQLMGLTSQTQTPCRRTNRMEVLQHLKVLLLLYLLHAVLLNTICATKRKGLTGHKGISTTRKARINRKHVKYTYIDSIYCKTSYTYR